MRSQGEPQASRANVRAYVCPYLSFCIATTAHHGPTTAHLSSTTGTPTGPAYVAPYGPPTRSQRTPYARPCASIGRPMIPHDRILNER